MPSAFPVADPLVAAADDDRLSPLALRIFVILVRTELDTRYHAWRRVKHGAVATRFQQEEGNVSRAFRLLTALGHLERGPNDGSPGRFVPTYRLGRGAA